MPIEIKDRIGIRVGWAEDGKPIYRVNACGQDDRLGVRVGWAEDGKPIYFAKRVGSISTTADMMGIRVGWAEDGKPVYFAETIACSPPPPPPPPPCRPQICCPCVPELLRIRQYASGPTPLTYTASWTGGASTGWPNDGGAWIGTRPDVGIFPSKVYCTNYFGGSTYYWNFEEGGAYVGASEVHCDPFYLRFEVPVLGADPLVIIVDEIPA